MSKSLGISLVLVMIVGMLGGLLSVSNMVNANDVVDFPDANLEDAIRDTMGKPTGDTHQSDLNGLTYLDAFNRDIGSLAGLEYCTDLTYLCLGWNQISDIQVLSNLTSLTSLSLSHNQITDIQVLSNLTSLTSLSLGWNQISDIQALSNLNSLTNLGLWGNQICDISPLANLTSLTELNLRDNQISDIEAMSNLNSLRDLDLGENQISDVEVLSNLINLTQLFLEENQISDIQALSTLTSLTNLGLGWNQISDIHVLSSLTSLTNLHLSSNRISDIKLLVDNPGLAEGDFVDLGYNPLGVTSLNTYIPQLEARGVYVVHGSGTGQFWELVYQADLSDVEPDKKAELMLAAKEVIERRLNAFGIADATIAVQEQLGEWNIAIQLPSIGEIDRVKKLIVRFALLEFKEQDEEGNWIPATGVVSGRQLILSSRYFEENTFISVDQYGKPLLVFEWDETGAELSRQVTTRLLGKPLAIFLGDEPLRGEDGHIIAPVVRAVVTDKGQIESLNLADAAELRDLLNAGRIPVPLGRWVKEGTFKMFEANIPLYEGPAEQPDCVVTLEQCQSGAYINPNLPLCWEINAIGIGDSFSVCVGDSTASNSISEVRFSSDDMQDGVPTGRWTEWYDWNTSSGDWHAGSKCMNWSFATGGGKEVWVQVEDSTGQTGQCFKEIAVTPSPDWFALPETITLSEVAFSAWTQRVIARIEKAGGALLDPIPVFVQGSYSFTGESVNIVLIVSPDNPRPTKYNLVRIRTNTVQGLTEGSLYVTLKSSGLLECAWHNVWLVPQIIDILTDPWGELVKEVAGLVAEALHISPFGWLMRISDLLECMTGGYTTELKGYEHGKDYLVYLPVGYSFTVTAQGAVVDWTCLMQANLVDTHCPHSQFRGQQEVTISDNLHEIYLDLQKAPWVFLEIFSPGELRVYDSQGRVTGLVSGEIWQEIPYSAYDSEAGSILICPATESYYYEVAGTVEGNYGMRAISISEEDEADIFALTEIPTSPNMVHRYTIDWDALYEGKEGVTVQTDSDGDGVFERTKTLRLPVASFTFSPSEVLVDGQIDFDASQSSDVDGEIVSYRWNFGDGNTSTGRLVTHAYSVSSDYTVSLVVVDNDGVVSSYAKTIRVRERQGMPIWGWAIIGVGIIVIAAVVLRRYRLVKR